MLNIDTKKLFLLFHEMDKAGIFPYSNNYHSIKLLLQNFPPADAKKLRRKFRKLWRKFLKKEIKRNEKYCTNTNVLSPLTQIIQKRIGLGANLPSRRQRKARRNFVKNNFWHVVQKQLESGD